MQTRFTDSQLADPEIAEAERILRSCVHCGFCTATCPTYVLLGDELDSPRGRIYLIKDMLEHAAGPRPRRSCEHIDRCLSCLACMTTCPSGVHYQHLIDHARIHVERTYRRPLTDRWLRGLLASVLPYPRRFRAVLRASRACAAVRRDPARAPARDARTRAAPPRARRRSEPDRAVVRSAGRRRVALLDGCVQSVVGANINAAARRLLERLDIEVVTVPGCCGSIVHHLGREAHNRALASPLIARLVAEAENGGLDAIVTTASGCGTHLKDYGHLFRDDPDLAAEAARVASLTLDITEFLSGLELPAPVVRPGVTVAYHSACSMQHGQGVDAVPRALLAGAGFDVKEIAEGHLCCGSAGTYNMLQPAARRASQRAQARQYCAHGSHARRDGQHRLHVAARDGGRRADRPYGGAARLGDGRAGACRRPDRDGRGRRARGARVVRCRRRAAGNAFEAGQALYSRFGTAAFLQGESRMSSSRIPFALSIPIGLVLLAAQTAIAQPFANADRSRAGYSGGKHRAAGASASGSPVSSCRTSSRLRHVRCRPRPACRPTAASAA